MDFPVQKAGTLELLTPTAKPKQKNEAGDHHECEWPSPTSPILHSFCFFFFIIANLKSGQKLIKTYFQTQKPPKEQMMQIRKQHLQFCVVASSTQDTAPKGFPAVGPPGTLVLPLKPHKSVTVVMPGA